MPCFLSTKSPWLKPIEPTWGHGTRCVVEPAGLLPTADREERVGATCAAPRLDHLAIPNEVT